MFLAEIRGIAQQVSRCQAEVRELSIAGRLKTCSWPRAIRRAWHGCICRFLRKASESGVAKEAAAMAQAMSAM